MRIHESVLINRPPDEVWAFLLDPQNQLEHQIEGLRLS
jgi:carbon monoxide dehydrogenase subunit G